MIVILAVISLIAAPIILSILTKVRKSAFQDSAYGIMEAAKSYYTESILDEGNPEDQVFSFEEGVINDLSYSGAKPKGGILTLSKTGEIELAIHNKEWCARKSKTETNVRLIKYEEGKCIVSENQNDPVIILNGNAIVYVELGGTYEELGVTVKTEDGAYTTEIRFENAIVSEVDTSKEGSYIITYRAKDMMVTRTVVVLEMKPVIKMTEENATYEKEKDILMNVSGIRPNKVESFTYEIKKDGNRIQTETVNGLTKTLTLNETGTYEVIVTVTDNNQHTNTLSKRYKIDTIPPEITVPENTVLKITEVAGYDLLTGVTVSDNTGITPTVKTLGSLNASIGEQTVEYEVIDEAGNIKTVVRTITVIAAEGPILNFSNVGSDIWTKGQTIEVTATDNANLKTFTYEIIKDGTSLGVNNVEVSGKSVSANVSLTESGIYSIKLTGSNEYNVESELSSSNYKIDTTSPTEPTMELIFENGTVYENDTWTNQDIYVAKNKTEPSPIGSTDEHSGVSKYQVSTDNKNWEDYTYNSNSTTYKLNTEGTHTRYFRAVGNVGNVSTSISRVAKIDKTAPTAGTATFVGTSGTNGWYKSDVTVNVVNGSDTLSGHGSTTTNISEITSYTAGTTVVITTTDNAGNSASREYTIKMDKIEPTISMSNVTIYDTEATSYNLMTGVTISDNSGVTPTVTTSGSLSSTPDTYTITYTVTDQAGNITTRNRNIIVKRSSMSPTELMNQVPTENVRIDNLGNKRYAGSDPNNYVCFGTQSETCDDNHLYRIIGVIDGKMKIIKNGFYSTSLRWDTTGGSYGVNYWDRPADLKTELNGTSFYGNSNYIDETSRGYIAEATWYTGGPNKTDYTLATFEDNERSGTSKGKSGLMSITDLGYASNNAACGRTTYLKQSNSACMIDNYLYNRSNDQWTLTPSVDDAYNVWYVASWGEISVSNVYSGYGVRPVLYLESSVKITEGDGTSGNPYRVSK